MITSPIKTTSINIISTTPTHSHLLQILCHSYHLIFHILFLAFLFLKIKNCLHLPFIIRLHFTNQQFSNNHFEKQLLTVTEKRRNHNNNNDNQTSSSLETAFLSCLLPFSLPDFAFFKASETSCSNSCTSPLVPFRKILEQTAKFR